ncbi:hypothetical protein LPJ53_002008 [Coemansia erecta]|uniref:NAD(P)-binding protein n=1 Tax=Coemansia erecta TaxID=147472 RepID=A0A9W7XYZ7_9FUNG|nr:hypothetical protein LPJ53_002008 [Coemansia erecta]
MALASGTNWLQSLIVRMSFGGNKLSQAFCGNTLFLCEMGYAMAYKFDITVPSPTSRIDRLVLDSRHQSTENTVPNEEKIAIVTGANSGLGFQTAKALGRAGFHTILACRSLERGQEAVELLERQTGLEGRFEVMELDLASIASVKAFVQKFKERACPLDILVCNGGIMMCPLAKSADDIELQFATNHVGHFVLTTGLLDELKQAADGARVVVMSSMGAFIVPTLDYKVIEDESAYDPTANYSMSKLANMVFTTALARKLEDTRVTVNVVHPGTISTDIARYVSGTGKAARTINDILFMTPAAGSVAPIYAALAPELEGKSGIYFNRCVEMDIHPVASNIEEQDRLWEYTEELVAKKIKE